MTDTSSNRVPAREVWRLAVPALGVLAAEPLYVLVDTAVVGHLGALPLAGLALGGTLLSLVSTQLTFLSYGTTARTARLYGAGRRDEAVREGTQATWLAVAVGLLVLLVGQLLAEPVALAMSGDEAVAERTVTWLRIALGGAPMIRYVLAGNALSAVLCPVLVYPVGWGLAGSAVANVVAQAVSASLFLLALVREGGLVRPNPKVMRAQLRLGRDLVLRSLAFQACFVSATSVAARTSTEAVGAHQVVWQLWTFLSLVLDSVAIAAQSLVGAALGANNSPRARGIAAQIVIYGLVFGCVLAVVFAAAYPVLPHAFTTDAGVLGTIPHAWWFFVALQPVAGVVFALDGVLLGAGDATFLRNATVGSAVLGYLPLIWVSLALGWGLVGIWTGLTLFMVLRLTFVVLRWRSGRWAVEGTEGSVRT